jgi:hypothetical protein
LRDAAHLLSIRDWTEATETPEKKKKNGWVNGWMNEWMKIFATKHVDIKMNEAAT